MAIDGPQIVPHLITKPLQLLAIWFATLLGIEWAFFWGAKNITEPTWISPTIIIAAIVFVPLFLIAAMIMQTKFRPQLQEDEYYLKWYESSAKRFQGFDAESFMSSRTIPVDNLTIRYDHIDTDEKRGKLKEDWNFPLSDEERRIKMYESHKGLFVVHSWRPSTTRGQVADIVIWLHQHREGPLSEGTVDHVEYYLGPMFFGGKTVTKRNSKESYKLEVSAYGPMLCHAKVFIQNITTPIELDRYIDFENTP